PRPARRRAHSPVLSSSPGAGSHAPQRSGHHLGPSSPPSRSDSLSCRLVAGHREDLLNHHTPRVVPKHGRSRCPPEACTDLRRAAKAIQCRRESARIVRRVQQAVDSVFDQLRQLPTVTGPGGMRQKGTTFSRKRSGFTPFGTTCTRPRVFACRPRSAAIAFDTATSSVAAPITRSATHSALPRSTNARNSACSSTNGALTSSTPGTSAARAYSIPAYLHSEYRWYTRSTYRSCRISVCRP